AVKVGNPTSDGEAQASPSQVSRAGTVGAVKAIEDVLEIFLGNADAGIGDGDAGVFSVLRKSDFAMAAARGVFDGVVDEDKQKTIERKSIGFDPNGISGRAKIYVERFVRGKKKGALLDFADVSAEFEWPEIEIADTGVGTGERKEIFEEIGGFDGSGENLMKCFAIFSGSALFAKSDFGGSPDHRDESAQIVRSVGGELGDFVEGDLNTVEDGIERECQALQFVFCAGNFEAPGKTLRANGFGGSDDAIYRGE